MKSILEAIEKTANSFPDHISVADDKEAWSYGHLLREARKIGSSLSGMELRNRPVAILLSKAPVCVAAMLGILYSGNFYVVLDEAMPKERMEKIFSKLEPKALITDESHKDQAKELEFSGQLYYIQDMTRCVIDMERLRHIHEGMVDTDPAYALFTSGSTGMPKGAVISHRALLSYTQWACETFRWNEDTVFGSQTPFYFSMSVTDLYGALRTGGRLQIIPKAMFSFPLNLMEYMNRYKINTIYWVPTALSLVATWDTFSYGRPEFLQMVLFAGESMPNRMLNYWRKHFPDLFYANLFGPTETTDISTWYRVDREFSDHEPLPIGYACDNARILIIGEDGKEVEAGDEGELYVGGSFLADGYYNDPEKTAAAFVQNPLNSSYPEVVYRTGDLVRRNAYGELMYMGRRDFQIKHHGNRVELGEIETAVMAQERMEAAVCLYDPETDQLILFYQGRVKEDALVTKLRERLPSYMIPEVVLRMKNIPVNANGKMDRTKLRSMWNTKKEKGE